MSLMQIILYICLLINLSICVAVPVCTETCQNEAPISLVVGTNNFDFEGKWHKSNFKPLFQFIILNRMFRRYYLVQDSTRKRERTKNQNKR